MKTVQLLQHLQQMAAGIDISGLPHPGADKAHLQKIFNLAFAISGSLAIVTIVVAGIRLIISRGSPQETAKAQTAVLFAVGGLVLIVLATAIVNFVVVKLA